MGLHYVPQRYLENFRIASESRPCIWRLDLSTGRMARVPIKRVEQVKGFYDSDVEIQLARRIENPANPVLSRLDSQSPITQVERLALAQYIGVMIKRVPFQREHARGLGRTVFKDILEEVQEEVAVAIRARKLNEDVASRGLSKIEGIFSEKQEDWIESIVRQPWVSESIVQAIEDMEWTVFRSAGPSYFLTSDNPICWDRSVGLETKASSFSFPISSRSLLIGARTSRNMGLGFRIASQSFVKALNRKTVKNAFKAVFYHSGDEWVVRLATNRREVSNRSGAVEPED